MPNKTKEILTHITIKRLSYEILAYPELWMYFNRSDILGNIHGVSFDEMNQND